MMKNFIKSIIPDYVEKIDDKIQILIHTDPGGDIDDEIASGYFIRHLLDTQLKYNINLVFSVKTKNVTRLLEYGIKPFTGIDLNPEFNFENIISMKEPNKALSVIFHDGTIFLPSNYFPDYILCIAPGLDSVIKESNLVNLKGLSHQGLIGTWNGFNDNGSKIILNSIITKNIPYVVTTPFESFNTLFGTETFKKYNIPEFIWDRIAQEAFKMIIGRMTPKLPASVLNYAESLVNMKYAETIGKPGTNSRLILEIRKKITGSPMEIKPELYTWIYRACVVYVDKLIESAKEQGAVESPIKHYEETIESLYEITVALAEMNMPYLDENGIHLNYSSDGNFAEKYPEAFEDFKKIGIFTPAYDLIAATKLIEMLEKNSVF